MMQALIQKLSILVFNSMWSWNISCLKFFLKQNFKDSDIFGKCCMVNFFKICHLGWHNIGPKRC